MHNYKLAHPKDFKELMKEIKKHKAKSTEE
jgi:hypothetical protein